MKARILPVRSSTWFALLLLVLISQHISLIGDTIPVTVLALPTIVVYMLGTRAARLDYKIFCLYLAFSTATLASYLLNKDNEAISYASLLYLLFLSAPLTLRITVSPALRSCSSVAFWDAYRAIMIIVAMLGLLQTTLGDSFFSFRDLLPEKLRVEGYNTTNALIYGGSIYRANGFVFYEPSFFSQFLALAILVEMRRQRNHLVIGLYLAALIASFSGTGIALLALGLVIQSATDSAPSLRRVFMSTLPLMLVVIVAVYLFPEFFLTRLDEFAQENSSAYIRFVSPALYIYEAFAASLQGLVFGVGPGVATSVRFAELMVDFPGIGKILYEYGTLGAVTLVLLYTSFSARAEMTTWIRWPLLFLQFVLNNGVFTPVTLVFFLMLAVTGNFRLASMDSKRRITSPPIKPISNRHIAHLAPSSAISDQP